MGLFMTFHSFHDYIRVLVALKKAARVNQIRLSPEEVMIDFEKAAKIAFGKNRSITSITLTVSNNPNAYQNEVICDLCSKIYKKRGLTKHRNNCLKKPQNWSTNRVIN
jgi:hypothetical protein